MVRRGYQYKAGFLDGIKREVITIYEILRDSANNLLWAVPDYQFTCAPFCLPYHLPWLALPVAMPADLDTVENAVCQKATFSGSYRHGHRLCCLTARLSHAGTMPPRRAMSAL